MMRSTNALIIVIISSSCSMCLLVVPLACCEARIKYSRFCLSVTKKYVAGPINRPPLLQFTHRVKVQTKTKQKVQCKGGLKLIFFDQLWVQSFKLNRLI